MSWYSQDIDSILDKLDSSLQGLSAECVKAKLEEVGKNRLKNKGGVNPWEILSEQGKDFFVILLAVASMIEIGLGVYHLGDGGVYDLLGGGLIVVIVLFIIILGFYQEYSSEKELEALKKILSPQATVVRNGETKQIPAENLVPGDIIKVNAGDRIPADARILESVDLRIKESALTGESVPVNKEEKILDDSTPLGDRKNMVFMGTVATYGRATAVVTATGMETELGKIAEEVQRIERESTPLQRQMDDLGRKIGLIVVIISFIIFLTLIITNWGGLNVDLGLKMFMIAVALAVAAVPEALPGVVTIGLSLGTRRMARENALIRKLPAVETLGSTTVIASDKTGTLTRNEMTAKKVWFDDQEIEISGEGYNPEGEVKSNFSEKGLAEALRGLTLCNNAELEKRDGQWEIVGDPTEGSLVVLGRKAGLEKRGLESEYPRVDEIPFTSERKMMTTIHENQDEAVAYVKGAPDVLLDKSSKIWQGGQIKELSREAKARVKDKNNDFAENALRMLAVAYKPLQSTDLNDEQVEKDLVFLGLVGIIDPARKEAKSAVVKCKRAGIRPIMITGDHKVTAQAIAEEVGIYHYGDKVLTGQELEQMSEEELKGMVDDVSIYARVSPQHKLKIVSALKDAGEIVAMTGDGVNDAPGLKKADIGVAMGITGTDVSKEAADMVLLDDNFASIVSAVEEGRGVYGNIKKYFAYLISGNIGEVGILFLSITAAPWLLSTFFGVNQSVPIALNTIQILLINLITDGLPAIALSWDPFEPRTMDRPPRGPKERIYKNLNHYLVWYPLIMILTMFILFLFTFSMSRSVFLAQTTTFLSIALFETGQAFACRSTRYPSLKVGIFKNKKLILAVISSLVIMLGLVYAPDISFFLAGKSIKLKDLFHFISPSPTLFFTILFSSSLGFIYLELIKHSRGEKL